MFTILFALLMVIFFIITLKRGGEIKELNKKLSQLTDEKKKLSNAVREKGIAVSRLERENIKLRRES